MRHGKAALGIVLMAGSLLYAACGSADPTPTPTRPPAATLAPDAATPTATVGAIPTAAPTPTATAAPVDEPGTVRLAPSKDATLYQDDSGGLANGAGEFLFAGVTRRGLVRRGLVEFDVAAAVPAGATVKSVTLSLFMSQTSSGPQPVALHRVLTAWAEGASDAPDNEGRGAAAAPGDATWTHTGLRDAAWESPGGDFSPEASAVAEVAGPRELYTWSSEAMVADVQSWLDDPSTNSGWVLVGNESTRQTAKRFDSIQNVSTFPEPTPPELTVVFEGGGTTPGGRGEPSSVASATPTPTARASDVAPAATPTPTPTSSAGGEAPPPPPAGGYDEEGY